MRPCVRKRGRNMPKLLLQEGNLSKPGCSGIANTTGEIRESDSACNYC